MLFPHFLGSSVSCGCHQFSISDVAENTKNKSAARFSFWCLLILLSFEVKSQTEKSQYHHEEHRLSFQVVGTALGEIEQCKSKGEKNVGVRNNLVLWLTGSSWLGCTILCFGDKLSFVNYAHSYIHYSWVGTGKRQF